MKYIKFKIVDYKGIGKVEIDLNPPGSNIFTLIGLNESGKTTILEAIANFGVNDAPLEVLFSEIDQPKARLKYIPKHKKANFTGRIKIIGYVEFERGEKQKFLKKIDEDNNCKLDLKSIPDVIEYTRYYEYKDSEFVELRNTILLDIKVKEESNLMDVSAEHRLWGPITSEIRNRFPKIIYFPTFLFTIPERILLNPGKNEEPINAIYRKVIEDVAGALPVPVDVQRHIVERMLGGETQGTVSFPDSEKQQAVFSTLEQMSYHLTGTIFSEWQKVLGAEYRKREVVLRPIVDRAGDRNNVYLQFSLKEGGSVFDISERSLGFRWFFSFLLFTHYRAKANLRGSALFLLDEPASNLHPKAQMQLLSSFSNIAGSSNAIIYSTHSHYMVNPRWLEQSFIVSNSAIEDSDEENSGPLKVNPPRITAERYRAFVGQNADKITYFQPVLDRIDYSPSKFDFDKPSLLVEGKGDYIIIEYIKQVILKDTAAPFIIPTRGATGMGDLIGLLAGWAIPFCVLLDDDKEGRASKSTYISEWGLSEDIIMTYRDINESMSGFKVEDILMESDKKLASEHFSIETNPTKSQLRLFFSEKLASGDTVEISEIAKTRVADLLSRVRLALSDKIPLTKKGA